MCLIRDVRARWILNSRGQPTVEVDVETDAGLVRSSAPSGASKGKREALEVLDRNAAFHGHGVSRAVRNVNDVIAPALIDQDPTDQMAIDQLLVELDGTENKSRLGANATVAVSTAVAKAGALCKGVPLYRHISDLLGRGAPKIPVPFLNVINGGSHAGNDLDIQEYMIVPLAGSISEALQVSSEIYIVLRRLLIERYGTHAVNVGDEGGFAPPIKDPFEPLDLLMEAMERSDHEVGLAIDAAASSFSHDGTYLVGDLVLNRKQLLDLYATMVEEYPLVSIEDPFAENDWEGFMNITRELDVQIVADDLTVSNPNIVAEAIKMNAARCVLLKVNQVGTLTEALQTANMAIDAGWSVMVSHRSGETEDTFIADLAIGLGCGQIKSGAPCRGERVAKYNHLLRLNEAGLGYSRMLR